MNQSFGFLVREMRNAGGASIDDLSRNIEISAGDLLKIENGSISASRDLVFRLANYFETNGSEFLRLSQTSRITQETRGNNEYQSNKREKTAFFKNSGLATKRIDNMKRDLHLLKARPVNVKLHTPVPELRPFIDTIVYCKDHNLGHAFESTLPDGTAQLQIVIGQGGRDLITTDTRQVRHLTKMWLMGINNTPVVYRLSEVEGVIYVRFKPAGLYAFTKIHQVELNNLVVDAKIIFGQALEDLWETLTASYQPEQMIVDIENFFLKRLRDVVVKPTMLTYMLDHIHLPLEQLAKKTGYSAKYLTRTFQKYIGVGPKTFQRIQRFNVTISHLNRLTGSVDWTEAVFRHGYHDQAHFIKDFKSFSGFTPQNYLSLGASCPRYLHTPHLPEHLF